MRSNQNKRMRGRNRKSQNPLSRVYESNGPDVKIRGSANHVAEKYVQLARDAQASGDPVGAENYYQHAEHYFRLIAAAHEQFRQGQPFYRPEGDTRAEEAYDDADDDSAGGEGAYGTREPQPYMPREAQPFPPRDGQAYPQAQPFPQREGQRQQPGGQGSGAEGSGDVDRLPAFITGGAPQQQKHQGNGQNGYEAGHQQADRYPMHRRRRRHRGPRGEAPPATQGADDAQ
jgi:hypothetical protein